MDRDARWVLAKGKEKEKGAGKTVQEDVGGILSGPFPSDLDNSPKNRAGRNSGPAVNVNCSKAQNDCAEASFVSQRGGDSSRAFDFDEAGDYVEDVLEERSNEKDRRDKEQMLSLEEGVQVVGEETVSSRVERVPTRNFKAGNAIMVDGDSHNCGRTEVEEDIEAESLFCNDSTRLRTEDSCDFKEIHHECLAEPIACTLLAMVLWEDFDGDKTVFLRDSGGYFPLGEKES